MKLLDAQKVKEEKNKKEEEKIARIKKLNDEETASVRRLTEALEKEKVGYERIAENNITFAREEIATEEKRRVLKETIAILEERKAEAMRPIDNQRKEAEALIEEARSSFVESERRTEAVVEREHDLQEKTELLIDMEADILERGRLLDERELKVAAADSELRKQVHELSSKIVDFHRDIHMANESIEIRERDILNKKVANETYAEALVKEVERQSEKERELVDRYATLQRATEEFFKKQNK